MKNDQARLASPTALLTESDVSDITRLSKATLRTNRCRRVGIPWIALGGAVRYKQEDVMAFIESNRRDVATR